ncbi:MAG: tRNA glutamyl-Q synthetase [Bacteroidetes bacterium]|nr:tRNA glutamyl-Q synthetase [Bacteroidota bacterium]
MVQHTRGKYTAALRTRFAPTPSGFLHAGNAANALIIFGLAYKFGAKVLLRIDDLDSARVRPEYLDNIWQVLDWLGLKPDEGPATPSEMVQWSQHQRLVNYTLLLDQLVATGRVYACSCSRNQLLQAGNASRYPGNCRHKNVPLEQPGTSWRLNTEGLDPVTWTDAWQGPQIIDIAREQGDFIIRRKDGLPAYHIASLSDDTAFGINLAVRGLDLIGSTGAQLLLAKLAGLTVFQSAVFVHHPLLKGADGQKLSKSAGAAAIGRKAAQSSLMEQGPSPAEHYRSAAALMGAEPASLPEQAQLTDLLQVFQSHDLPHPHALPLSL